MQLKARWGTAKSYSYTLYYGSAFPWAELWLLNNLAIARITARHSKIGREIDEILETTLSSTAAEES